jgi:23S rRNA (pseudouridine1915-N3)-methyltransferase
MRYNIRVPKSKCRAFYQAAAEEYEKRLGRFCRVEIWHGTSKAESARKHPGDFTIGFSPAGQLLNSKEFAERLRYFENHSSDIRAVNFVWNTENCDETWALMYPELPFDAQTVFLLEQLYRAQKILHNEVYDK